MGKWLKCYHSLAFTAEEHRYTLALKFTSYIMHVGSFNIQIYAVTVCLCWENDSVYSVHVECSTQVKGKSCASVHAVTALHVAPVSSWICMNAV